jgi:hypothetical protein
MRGLPSPTCVLGIVRAEGICPLPLPNPRHTFLLARFFFVPDFSLQEIFLTRSLEEKCTRQLVEHRFGCESVYE